MEHGTQTLGEQLDNLAGTVDDFDQIICEQLLEVDVAQRLAAIERRLDDLERKRS